MNRRVALFLSIFILLPFIVLSKQTKAASTSLVINSYRVAGTKSTDEYIEIYNPTSQTVQLTGWQIAKKTASGTKYNLITSFPAAQVKPSESLIVGHKDSALVPDINYATDYSVSEDNTIILYSDAGKTVVDRVGFGKASDFEGTVLPPAGSEIWSRTNGADTDNNLTDFKKYTGPTKDYSGICLSEIEPSPSEGDEWIELYNSEMSKDIGGLIIADKLGATKQFTLPEGTIIGEGQYLVFYKKDTGITLNDEGDGVVLIDATGKVFDETGESFGKATKGYSYAFSGLKWLWTQTPTPGAANKISAVGSLSVIDSKKRAALSSESSSPSQKGTVPSAQVLGSTSSNSASDIFSNSGKNVTPRDRFFGLILIGVALAGGLVYTGYVNRERLIEVFNKERAGYSQRWQAVRSKMFRR